MWDQKNKQEIGKSRREHYRDRLKAAIFTGFAAGLIMILTDRGWLSAIIIGIISALLSYFVLNRRRATVVCAKCGRIKYGDNVIVCQCGGHFRNIKEMKWIEK